MKERISATVDKKTINIINEILKKENCRNKSHVIETVIKFFMEKKYGNSK